MEAKKIAFMESLKELKTLIDAAILLASTDHKQAALYSSRLLLNSIELKRIVITEYINQLEKGIENGH